VNALTDEQLIEQLQQGRTGALDDLYKRHARKLYAFCSNATRSGPQDAEDLVQDIFVRVIKAADTFNPQKASFRTWLFRIARNRCIDVGRRSKLVQFVPIGTQAEQADGEERVLAGAIADQSESTEEALARSSAMDAVRDCIHELTNNDEKQAILLYYLGGKVYREIGQILGESLSMARNRVKSAQEKVKRCLERKGIDSLSS
jgi:RNA polymerase sigma factor (sigma-70 family)